MDPTRLIVYFPLGSATVCLAVILALLFWPAGGELRLRLRRFAFLLSVGLASIYAGTAFTLGRRPWLFGFVVFAIFAAWTVRRMTVRKNLQGVTGVALVMLAASSVVLWGFLRPPGACDQMEQPPGVRRIDVVPAGSPAVSALPEGVEAAPYSVALSPDENTLYVSYAHLHEAGRYLMNGWQTAANKIPPRPPFDKEGYGGIYEMNQEPLGGLARMALDRIEAPEFLPLPGRDLVRIRVHPRNGDVYVLDMHAGTIFVVGDRPLRLVRRIETGASELCDVLFDPPSGRFFVLTRSGFGRTEGIWVYEDVDPPRLIGKFGLPNSAPGASELLVLPDSTKAYIYSEGFVNLIETDLAGAGPSRTGFTWLPGFLDGAISSERRELYLVNLMGFLQVWDTDRFVRKRTRWIKGGVRATAYSPITDRLYLSDYFRGDLLAVDPSTLTVESRLYLGPRAREMIISRRGMLYLPTSCGIFEVRPSALGPSPL